MPDYKTYEDFVHDEITAAGCTYRFITTQGIAFVIIITIAYYSHIAAFSFFVELSDQEYAHQIWQEEKKLNTNQILQLESLQWGRKESLPRIQELPMKMNKKGLQEIGV